MARHDTDPLSTADRISPASRVPQGHSKGHSMLSEL
jgi:hypothetical protein